MSCAVINGTELFYKVVGEGAPSLVMHGGLGLDHTMLHPWLDPLGDVLKLVYYDHRNNGRSGRPPLETMSWEQLADDAEGLRSHLDFGSVSIIAHSFGGFPAMEYALRYPNSVRCLILIGAVPAFDYFSEVIMNMRMRGASEELIALFDFNKATCDEVFKGVFKQLAPLYFHRPTEDLIEHALGRVRFCAESCRVTRQLIETYSLEPRLRNIDVPTLIISGEDDFVTPVSQGQRLYNGISHATMVRLEKCGHLPFIEAPKDFFRVVRPWLENL